MNAINPPIAHSRPWINHADTEAVARVLQSGMISRGEKTMEFEEKVGEYLGLRRGIACASGTDALVLALQTLRIGSASQVILPTYVCHDVLDAVLSVGAMPQFCDVNETGVVSVDTIRPHITKKTAAIIAVHIFGHPCDIPSLQSLGVPVIEDACQAFGLSINGKMAGSLGELGILSFHATKCLTTGEGGMLVGRDEALLNKARVCASNSHGASFNSGSCFSDMQAALGLSQLNRYDEFITRRRRIQKMYLETMSNVKQATPRSAESQFLFRMVLAIRPKFSNLQRLFLRHGVHVRKGVDELLHHLAGKPDRGFPNAKALFERSLSIPFYPALTNASVAKICKAIELVFHEN